MSNSVDLQSRSLPTMAPETYEIPDSDQEDEGVSQLLSNSELISQKGLSGLSAAEDQMEGISMIDVKPEEQAEDQMEELSMMDTKAKEQAEGSRGTESADKKLGAQAENEIEELIKLTTARLADAEEGLTTAKDDLQQMEEYDDSLDSQYPAEDPAAKIARPEADVEYYRQCLHVLAQASDRLKENAATDSDAKAMNVVREWVERKRNKQYREMADSVAGLESQITELKNDHQKEKNIRMLVEEQARRLRIELQSVKDERKKEIAEADAIAENARVERAFRIERARLYGELRNLAAVPDSEERMKAVKGQMDLLEEDRMIVWWEFVESMDALENDEKAEMWEYRESKTRLGRERAAVQNDADLGMGEVVERTETCESYDL